MEKMKRIELVRSESRLTGSQLVSSIITDFEELHGDRYFGEDSAIMAGVGMLFDIPVTVICQNKGNTLEERIANSFGMAHPEGYRKAIRLAKLSEKFNRPIVTIVDTVGAYPGIGSEERGQASAIASCLECFADLKVPIITVVVSEGGSGGALALAQSDYIFAFENSYYSVISPEGYAEILYKSKRTVDEIIDELPIFTEDLLAQGIIEQVIEEPSTGVVYPLDSMLAYDVKDRLANELKKLGKLSKKELVKRRYERFRKFGK